MDKIWQRGVIKYMRKKDLTTKYIYVDTVATLGDGASASSTVQMQAVEFRRGRESFENDLRYGRLATYITKENIDFVHYMVMDDK